MLKGVKESEINMVFLTFNKSFLIHAVKKPSEKLELKSKTA